MNTLAFILRIYLLINSLIQSLTHTHTHTYTHTHTLTHTHTHLHTNFRTCTKSIGLCALMNNMNISGKKNVYLYTEIFINTFDMIRTFGTIV